MKFYRLDVMAQRDPEFCVLTRYPEDMGLKTYKITTGEEALPGDYPEDAKIYMSDQEPGMVVPGLVGNTCNLLILCKPLKEALEQINKGPTQYLPVEIYNHKKRLASSAHFVVNPLGTHDVLDTAKSKIEYHQGEVVQVVEYVLDPEKVKQAPDLFRIKENPYTYVITERVLSRWRTIVPKPTNVSFTVMEVP